MFYEKFYKNWEWRATVWTGDRAGILTILLVFALFFLPVLMAGKTLYPTSYGRSIQFNSDVATAKTAVENPIYLDHGATDWIEAPINAVVKHSIASGEWPLWNPYNSMGMPVLGNLNGATVAPLGLILDFYNSEFAWNAMYVLRLFFAVILTYYFIRRLGLGQLESVSGAILFGFSGYSQLNLNMFHFHVDAWLPFLFWATLKFIQERSRVSWLMVFVAITALILGGNPQNLILSCIVSVSFFIALMLGREGRTQSYRVWVAYFSAFSLAIGVCSFYEASFYELFQRALKYHDGVGLFSLPYSSLLGLSFPVFGASPGVGDKYLPYLGLLTIPVIFAGLRLAGQFRLVAWFFLITGIFFLLKTVGFPVVNWIGGLPVLDNILFTKYLSPMYFAISVLFAVSVGNLLKERAGIEFAIAVIVSIVFLFATIAGLIEGRYKVGFIVYWLLLSLFFVSVGFIPATREKGGSRLFVFVVLGCILAELFFVRISNLKNTLDAGVAFSTPKFVEFIRLDRKNEYDRVFGVGSILMGNQASLYQLHDIRGMSATTDNRYYVFMRDLVQARDLDLHPYVTTSSTFHPEGRPILNLLGVQYIIFDDCKAHQIESAVMVYKQMCMEVFKNEAAFDRAFVVHDFRELDSDAEILQAMASGSVDLSRTALVAKGSIASMTVGSVASDSELKEVAHIEGYKSNEVTVSVHMKSAGMLILSDLIFPGWRVKVDDNEKELLTVDYALRGVFLGAGQHRVRFEYRPDVLSIGGAVSLVFLLLGVVLYVIFPYTGVVQSNFKTRNIIRDF